MLAFDVLSRNICMIIGFTVLMLMADLVYDNGSKYLKISSGNDGGRHEPRVQ